MRRNAPLLFYCAKPYGIAYKPQKIDRQGL